MATDNRKNFLNVLTRRGTDKSVPSYFYAPTKSLADSVFWPVADPNVTVSFASALVNLTPVAPTTVNTSPLPVTFTNKTSGTSVVDGTTFATTAITTVTGKLYLMAVTVSSAQNATVSSISSAGGVSWTKVTNANPVNSGATQLSDIELWYGVCSAGASGVSWTITKSASTTNTGDSYIIDEVSNAASTGVIVQSVIANNDSTSPVSGTLTAFSYSLNAVYSIGAVQAFTPSLTIEGGWTQLANVQVGGIPTITKTSYSTTQDTTPSYTFSGTIPAAALIAVEIKSAFASDHKVVTFPSASVTLSSVAPTTTVTNPQVVTFSSSTITLSSVAPTTLISDHKLVSIPPASITLSTVAPSITASNHIAVSIPAASLSFTASNPTTLVSDNKIVSIPAATITLSSVAPSTTITSGTSVTFPSATVTLTAVAPNTSKTDNIFVSVPSASITLSTVAPNVTASNNKTVTFNSAQLNFLEVSPAIGWTDNKYVSIPSASVSFISNAPTISLTDHKIVYFANDTLSIVEQTPTILVSDHISVSFESDSVSIVPSVPTVFITYQIFNYSVLIDNERYEIKDVVQQLLQINSVVSETIQHKEVISETIQLSTSSIETIQLEGISTTIIRI